MSDAQFRDVLDRLRDKKAAVRAGTLALATDLLSDALAAAAPTVPSVSAEPEADADADTGDALLRALPARCRTLTNRVLGAYTLGFDEDRRAALAALVAVLTRQPFAAVDGTEDESSSESPRTSPWSPAPRRRSSAASAGSRGDSTANPEAWCTAVVEMLVAALDERAELALHAVLRDQCVARTAFIALCDATSSTSITATAEEEKLIAAAALGGFPRERVHAFFTQLLGSRDATVQAFVAKMRTLCGTLDFGEGQRTMRALARTRQRLPALLNRRGRRDAQHALVFAGTLMRACAAHLLVTAPLFARVLAARHLGYCVAAARLHPTVAAPHLRAVVAALRSRCRRFIAKREDDMEDDEEEEDENKEEEEEEAEKLLEILCCNAAEGLAERDEALFTEAREVLAGLLVAGDSTVLAKRAVGALAVLTKGRAPVDVFGTLGRALADALDASAPRLPVLLQGLGCIALALRDSTAFDRIADGAVVFVTDRLLRRRQSSTVGAAATSGDDDDGVGTASYEHRVAACAAGVKFLARYLTTNTTSLAEVSSPIIAQIALIASARQDASEAETQTGTGTTTTTTDECLKDVRVRSAAAGALLRLARCAQYDRLFTPALLQLLAGLAEDRDAGLRAAFERKLARGLGALRLPLRYLGLLAFYASEPRRDVYTAARTHLQQCVALRRRAVQQAQLALAQQQHQQQAALSQTDEGGADEEGARALERRQQALHLQLPEYALPYVLSLLAHDPALPQRDYLRAARCLHQLVAALVHGSDDFVFLRQLVAFAQTTDDARRPPRPAQLRAACEVARRVLQRVAESRAWRDDAAAHPATVFLPPQYFCAPDPARARREPAPLTLIIADYDVYASPPEFTTVGNGSSSSSGNAVSTAATTGGGGRRQRAASRPGSRSTGGTPARKRTRLSAPARTRSRRRRTVDDDDSEDDENSERENDESDEDEDDDDEVYVSRSRKSSKSTAAGQGKGSNNNEEEGMHPRLRPRRADVSYVEDDLNDETFAVPRRRRPSSAAAAALHRTAGSSSEDGDTSEATSEDEERAQSAPAPPRTRKRAASRK